MITNNTFHRDNSDSMHYKDMSALLMKALYEESIQHTLMSQEFQERQQRSTLSLPSNANINQINVPGRISFDGQLYALLPIIDQGIGGAAANHLYPPIPVVGNTGSTGNIIEQHRDDVNTTNSGNAIVPSNASRTQTRSIPHKKVKKSRSGKHPRPRIHVPAMAFVSIKSPSANDVLMGRGGRINKHVGNVQLRNIVAARQDEYLSSSTGKLDKAYIAADIVASIRLQCHPPGRFLEQNQVDQTWYEIGDERAIRKVLQALREHAPEFRSSAMTYPSSASRDLEQQTEV